MDISTAIEQLLKQRDLSQKDMQDVMQGIMTGQNTDAQIAGFLIALRAKGESVDEITAAAQIMRNLSTKVSVSSSYALDMVGTGGDKSHSFNISTASSFVIAAAGGHVAKHGNRSVSSQSGSADLLEAAGVNLNLTPEQVGVCIEQVGMGFMFAPLHHSAMKYAITARKDMGVRTIFNLLGPLTNPANVKHQMTGVFAKAWVEPVARALAKLGSEHVVVVHSEDGLDEISISAPSYIAELKDGVISTEIITPDKFGFERAPLECIKVENVDESLAMIHSVLNNEQSPAWDIVCLNAGVAIYVAGLTVDMQSGIDKAREVIASNAAKDKLAQLVAMSQSF